MRNFFLELQSLFVRIYNLVYDIEKCCVDEFKIPLEEISTSLLEESHSNFKIKDENWNETSLVYKIFIHLTNDYNIYPSIQPFMTKKFIYALFCNINSYDSEERLIVKLIFYQLYSGNIVFRKQILEVLEDFLIDLNLNNQIGLSDCFDLLKCIFLGLNKPLSKKNSLLLERTILYTFKNKQLKSFWINYKNFLLCLIKEDICVLQITINFIYKSWPCRYPDKIVLVIEFLETLFSLYQSEMIKLSNFKKICSKIIVTMSDMNIIVADKALISLKNDQLLKTIINEFNYGLKVINLLVYNIKNHWCDDIKNISKLVLSKIKTAHPNLLAELDKATIMFIDSIQFSQGAEDLWELLRFELKAD